MKEFSCWKQFLCLAVGQLTHREHLSDTIICLQANPGKMYHLGIGEIVSKCTLSKASENRSFQIYENLAMLLIKEAKLLSLGGSGLEVHLANSAFAVDATTTMDLCLSTFDWARFRSTKGGIKLPTPSDLKTAMLQCILFSNRGKMQCLFFSSHRDINGNLDKI